MMVQYIRKTVFFLLVAVLSTACVKEDLSKCAFPLTLAFYYTHNVNNEDLFTEEINIVTLFIYDTQGKLIKQEVIEREDMIDQNKCKLVLAPGTYKIIAFGNAHHMYDYKSVDNYQEAINSVRRDNNRRVAPAIESLFHGMIDLLTVTGTQKQEHKVVFHKNSNLVRVILRSTNPANQLSHVECKISAINGDYKFDNTIYGNERIHYIPLSTNTIKEFTNDFKVLRLWQGDDSMLSVVENNTGVPKTWYNGSLTELLLKKPGTDLDLQDNFEVILTLNETDQTVKITVNNWEVIDHNSGL